MTFIQKTILILSAVLIPATAVAAAPANIRQVEASMNGASLTVSWAPAESGDIDFYRIYISHESILDHEGNYDDSVRTQANETTYVFATAPLASEKIYVAILAVNKEGEESEGFESEASVALTPPPAMEPVPAPEPEPAPVEPEAPVVPETSIPMTVSEVRSITQTGVLITFTKPIADSAPIEARFFAIIDGSGAGLEISAIEVIGQTILLHTGVQESEKSYFLSILEPMTATDGTNLPVQEQKLPFSGFFDPNLAAQAAAGGDIPYVANPELPVAEEYLGPPEDAVNLALRAMRRSDGTYTVVASWGASPNSKGTLSAYVLSSTRNGEAHGGNIVLASNQTVTKYDAVAPGIFGVKVVSKDDRGNESMGIQKVITLPESGMGLLGIITASGFVAGKRVRRKRRAA